MAMVRPISEIRRPEIVKGAIAALAKNGLSMLSYDLIAEEAEMSRQLIRHYFPDTELLMLAVCDELATAYRDALSRGIVATGSTGRLDTFLDFYFDLLAGNGPTKPQDDAAYDAMFAVATGSDAVRRNLHAHYTGLRDVIADEVRIGHPSLDHTECKEIGFLFVSLMYGHWRMVATLGFSDDNNAVTRAAMDRIVASYLDRTVCATAATG